jgi:hypothetical protein
MEDLIMKKLRFVLIGFTLMLGLVWCATANAAECSIPNGTGVVFDPAGAGLDDDVELIGYLDGEIIHVFHINWQEDMYDFEDPDVPSILTIDQSFLDSTGFHVEDDWDTQNIYAEFEDVSDYGDFTTLADVLDAGCISLNPGDCECGAVSPFIIDPNVMFVYETGETEGDFGISMGVQPEPGETVTVTIDDPNIPGLSVDIRLIGGDPCEGTITLVFDEFDWDQPQTVAFKAIDDTVADVPDLEEAQKIYISSVYSATLQDPNWVGEKVVTVNVFDNDQPNILFTVTPADSDSPKTPILPFPETIVQLWEESGWRKIGVTLQVAPTGDPVELRVVVEGDNLPLMDPPLTPTSDPNTLIFTAGNYNVSQDIKIWGNDDSELQAEDAETEGDQNYEATLLVWVIDDGGDEGYAVFTEEEPKTVEFDIADNECGAWGYVDADTNEDCSVDLEDFLDFYDQWLDCADPQDPACESYL